MKKEPVEIQIPIKLIQERLTNALVKGGEENGVLISKMIIENLEPTDMGISQMIMAFMGMEETTNWVVGDECMVHPDRISTWECDKEEMIKRGHSIHKDHIKGKIKNIDLRKKYAVTFEFNSLYKSSTGEITERKATQPTRLVDLKSDDDLKLVRPDLAGLM